MCAIKRGGLHARSRKAVQISDRDLIESSHIQGSAYPLVISPKVADLNLVQWAARNTAFLEEKLNRYGALLLRGFSNTSVAVFEDFVKSTSNGPLTYQERSSPREAVKGNVYTATSHPSDQEIFLHNEQSYNLNFPQKIYFYCDVEPKDRGATPIADTRKILSKLDKDLVEKCKQKQYIYRRNFGNGFGLSWPVAFQTESREEVEAYCNNNQIDFEWKPGNGLRTSQVRPCLARHPKTGESVWFNHRTFFNVTTLDEELQERLVEAFAPEDLPNHTFFGDGEAISHNTLDGLRAVYQVEKTVVPWKHGDVLMLDNMLMCHGREPFSGDRHIVVAMADPVAWEDVVIKN